MGKPKPQAMPFENNTTNTFGWQSLPQDSPFVQRYMNTPVEIDPGAQQRTDLEEQASGNKWNSAFTMGIPESVRMMMQGSEKRAIQQQGADAQQQAKFRQNALNLQKNERMLPQLTQTGGKSTGFNSVYSQPGFFGRIGNSFADAFGSVLGSGAGMI